MRCTHRKTRSGQIADNVREKWLGILDSNQDRRSQSPLFYH